jgi:hypothetical protein
MIIKPLLTASTLLLLACGCDPKLTTLEVPAEIAVTVPGRAGLGGNPLSPQQVFPPNALSQVLSDQLAQSFSTQGVDKDAVDSIKLTQFELIIDDPDEAGTQVRDLGFLESLGISCSGGGVGPVVVATSAAGAFGTDPAPTSYAMPLTGAELKPVLDAAESIEMAADMVPSDQPPNFDTEVRFVTNMTVLINVVGALNGNPNNP